MDITAIISSAAAPILGAILGLVVSLIPVLKDTAESNWKRQFRKQVRLGVVKNHLTYVDMQNIAERWSQDRKSILFSLRIMHSEAISGEDEDLSGKLQEIRDLIQAHQDKEPYSELPENISLQLDAISGHGEVHEKQISQLAASLSELYISNQKKLSRQTKFTYWGAIAGVIGVFIGVAGLYFAVTSSG